MNDEPATVLTLTRIEAAHLRDLVEQFAGLLDEAPAGHDPALERLTPDAYPEDAEASHDFRGLTRGDLLGRRSQDASAVLRALDGAGAEATAAGETADPLSPVDVPIAVEALDAWLRTLTAVRLVLASRLDIETAEDHDEEDPRFALYDWLGYRLDGLLRATEPD